MTLGRRTGAPLHLHAPPPVGHPGAVRQAAQKAREYTGGVPCRHGLGDRHAEVLAPDEGARRIEVDQASPTRIHDRQRVPDAEVHRGQEAQFRGPVAPTRDPSQEAAAGAVVQELRRTSVGHDHVARRQGDNGRQPEELVVRVPFPADGQERGVDDTVSRNGVAGYVTRWTPAESLVTAAGAEERPPRPQAVVPTVRVPTTTQARLLLPFIAVLPGRVDPPMGEVADERAASKLRGAGAGGKAGGNATRVERREPRRRSHAGGATRLALGASPSVGSFRCAREMSALPPSGEDEHVPTHRLGLRDPRHLLRCSSSASGGR